MWNGYMRLSLLQFKDFESWTPEAAESSGETEDANLVADSVFSKKVNGKKVKGLLNSGLPEKDLFGIPEW